MLTDMTSEELAKGKVSKAWLERLLGQIYDTSGLLTPIRACFLSIFSKICLLLKDWKSFLPSDSEIAVSVFSILQELATDLPLIRPLGRCRVPEGPVLQRYYCAVCAVLWSI